MSEIKSPIAKPATAESIVTSELDRIERRVDSLWDDNHEIKYKLEATTPILIALAVGLIATFAASAYYAQKTNERLDRLERINGIDEIGRRR